MFGGRGVVVAVCSAALAASSFAGAPATRAAGLIVCAGQESTTYDPGLTLVPRPTVLHATSAYTCSGRPGESVAAAGRTEGVSPEASCLAVDSPRARERVRFADGRESVISYEGSALRAGGAHEVHLTGHVVEGFAEGAEVTRDVSLLPASLPTDCATVGVPAATGQGQLRIAF
ncbi:hypothetical protein AB0H73_07410 [Streptomyces olivoreticuli]